MTKLKSPRKTPLQDAGFAVLRTPLIPMSVILEWSSKLMTPTALAQSDAELERCIDLDRLRLVNRLRNLLSEDIVRQAIYVASPNVARSMNNWLENPEDKRGRKSIPTLISYLLRMAYRPTPFGLFAGCTTLKKGPSTRFELSGIDQYRSHSRLDIVYLATLCQKLVNIRTIREALTFHTNQGLYQVAGQWRLAESEASVDGDARRTFHLVSIESSEHLQSTLTRASKGATIAALVTGLLEDYPDVSLTDAQAYVEELIENQLLVSTLEPRVTGEDALDGIISTMVDIDGDQKLIEPLKSAAAQLARIDQSGPAASLGKYTRVAKSLTDPPFSTASRHTWHVDLYKPAVNATIGPKLIGTVRDGINLLHSICPPAPREDLSTFVSDFQARYQDREIPLMQALDEESGIGFGKAAPEQSEDSPLIAGLDAATRSESLTTWSTRDAIVLRLLCNALRSGKQLIKLTQTDIETLSQDNPQPLPAALSANVTVVSPSAEAIEKGEFELLWHGAFGPSGAMYLGRFCHGDSELKAWVERHLAAEERHRPDAIFAEIVHLPQDRIGNVICRPSLRSYEIPYHGGSGVAQERQIPVGDLLIRIVNGRVVLRSERLGREVIPRLSTAHNATQTELGVYRFLCALQTQGVCHWLAWDWGILEGATYLPRIQAGRLVFARARWRLDSEDLKQIAKARSGSLIRVVKRLSERIGLPRWVQVTQVDRLLPLDLENITCVELLSAIARDKQALDLTEVFPTLKDSCVSGPEGGYNHELIIPLEQPVATGAEAALSPHHNKRSVKLFTPGSEWLYVKIYTGFTQAEGILNELVATFVNQERLRGSFDRWFYVRYADPHPHLRLRFHGQDNHLGSLWARLQAALTPLVENESVWRIQLDTYDPEIERYGGPQGIELSETIFDADSDASLQLLALVASGATRWQIASLSVHRLFEDLAIDLDTRICQLGTMRKLLASEFEFDEPINRSLARKYRELRSDAEAILTSQPSEDLISNAANPILDERSKRLVPIGAELHRAQMSGLLEGTVEELSLSYVHMTANRLFRAAARVQELVLYELLIRHYRTSLARQSQKSQEKG